MMRSEAEAGRRRANILILTLAFVLFSTITVAQFIASEIANSAALAADCVSMGVDALSFLASLTGEIFGQESVQLLVSFASYAALFGFTIYFLLEGIANAQAKDGKGREDVNGYIVLAFALFGCFFDLVTLSAYAVYSDSLPPSLSSMEAKAADGDSDDEDDTDDNVPARRSACRSCSIANPIMLAAFFHVLSDLLRSLATLVEALTLISIAENGSEDDDSAESTRTDGIASKISPLPCYIPLLFDHSSFF